jgi:hypothetical protein
MLGVVCFSWLFLVAGLVSGPDDRQPVPGHRIVPGTVDFHPVFPCWLPDEVVENPWVGVAGSDPRAALISYPPRRPSYALGGLVPSRVGLYLKERRDQFQLGTRLLPPVERRLVGDVEVALGSLDDGAYQLLTWVNEGVVFELGGAGLATDELLAVVESTLQPCGLARGQPPVPSVIDEPMAGSSHIAARTIA